jgi:anti-sigma regulatory factor (Ser/Thr protein kinase)
MELTRTYPPDPATPRRVREDVAEALAPVLGPRRLADVELMASEVATNAILHSDGEDGVELRIRLDGDSTRVEITNTGPAFDPDAPPKRDGPSGWGLRILSYLADDWGVEVSTPNVVWFQVDLQPSGAEPTARSAR